jgi:hypothetical protein
MTISWMAYLASGNSIADRYKSLTLYISTSTFYIEDHLTPRVIMTAAAVAGIAHYLGLDDFIISLFTGK